MNARFRHSSNATDSDSSDDIAIIKIANKNSYQFLCRPCWQKCKYCNKVLISRFAVLKHNLNHLTVPLVKQPIYRCKQCLNYYLSPETLASHISKKHKDVLTNSCTSVKLKLVHDLKSNFKKRVSEDDFEDKISDTEEIEDDRRISDLEEDIIVPDVVKFATSLEEISNSSRERTSDDEEFNNFEEKVPDLDKFVNDYDDRMSDGDQNDERISDFEELDNDFEEETTQVNSNVENPEISKILQSMVEKQVVIKCKDDLKEVLKGNRQTNSYNHLILEESDSIFNGIEEKNILQSIVEKEPIIKCKKELNIHIANKNYSANNDNILENYNNLSYNTSSTEIDEANLSNVVIKQEFPSINDCRIDVEEHDILQNVVENQTVVKYENELQNNFNKHDKTGMSNQSMELIGCNIGNMQLKNRGNMQLIGSNIGNMQLKNRGNMQLIGSKTSNTQLKNRENMQLNLNDTQNEEVDDMVVKEELLSPKCYQNDHSMTEEEKEPIRHRLLFEEDLEDTLFNNLPTNNTEIETLCEEIDLSFDKTSHLSMIHRNNDRSEKMNVNDGQNETTDTLCFGKAVHYDTLVSTELCWCKRCGQEFPNRFELIQHEPTHMTRKNWRAPFCVFCERYIGGNFRTLRIHKEQFHQELPIDKNYKLNDCNLCGLKYYNYRRHVKHYHEIYKCGKCDNRFQTLKIKNEHVCGRNLVTNGGTMNKTADTFWRTENGLINEAGVKHHEMSLCELCFSFMKIYIQNRSNYEVIGHRSKIGEQQTCEKCNTKVFESFIICRRILKHKNVDQESQLQNDCNIFSEIQKDKRNFMMNETRTVQKQRKPVVTNEKRLKNIRSRLKMLKQIKKY